MSTALSPEWDRWFDEEFTDLVSRDEDLVRAEFDALIDAGWHTPPPAEPPASTASGPAGESAAAAPGPIDEVRDGRTPEATADGQRSPPA